MTVSYEDAVREATDYLAEADLHLARTGRLPSIPLPADLLRTLLSGPPEREGWVLAPKVLTPAMMERAAFNLCAEYGVEFVQPLGQFVKDAYAELLSAAPTP
jgi:hypothetical protein